jgi:hypothetical protein
MTKKQPTAPQKPQQAPEQPVEGEETPIDTAPLDELAGTLVDADGNPIAVPAGDLAAELAAGGTSLEPGAPPLELGEALGGALPPQGDEVALEPQPKPKGPRTVVGPNGTITQVFE